ncbi:MAG: hypothetical protein PGMFKBFP_02349 [Anaerolineales bacterium]|nr:hypothetical protein [Anaerolineales bacterium]
MVVIGKGQVLDAVVHRVAQVVADVRGHPLGQIPLKEVEDRGRQAKTEQEQRRVDEVARLAFEQALVHDAFQDVRDDERQSRDYQKDEQVEQDLPEIGFEIRAEFEERFHGFVSGVDSIENNPQISLITQIIRISFFREIGVIRGWILIPRYYR